LDEHRCERVPVGVRQHWGNTGDSSHTLRTGDLYRDDDRSTQQTGNRGTLAGHQLRYAAEDRSQTGIDEGSNAKTGIRAQAAGSLGFAERRRSILSYLLRGP